MSLQRSRYVRQVTGRNGAMAEGIGWGPAAQSVSSRSAARWTAISSSRYE